MEPCVTCKYYDPDNVDITCKFCRGEYIDRWEPKEDTTDDGKDAETERR